MSDCQSDKLRSYLTVILLFRAWSRQAGAESAVCRHELQCRASRHCKHTLYDSASAYYSKENRGILHTAKNLFRSAQPLVTWNGMRFGGNSSRRRSHGRRSSCSLRSIRFSADPPSSPPSLPQTTSAMLLIYKKLFLQIRIKFIQFFKNRPIMILISPYCDILVQCLLTSLNDRTHTVIHDWIYTNIKIFLRFKILALKFIVGSLYYLDFQNWGFI